MHSNIISQKKIQKEIIVANQINSILRSLSPALSVGAISADLLSVGTDITRLEKAGISLLHFDIMDGLFAPMLTVGSAFVKVVKTTMLKDVHLMVERPLDSIRDYASAGADIITVHAESTGHIHRALQMIGELTNVNDPQRGIARGIAINPSTPVETLEPFLEEADIIFLLAVNPGYGGQKFIQSTPRRVGLLRELTGKMANPPMLGIDGGVTRSTIETVASLKPDVIVTGSAVFEGRAIEENIVSLNNTLK